MSKKLRPLEVAVRDARSNLRLKKVGIATLAAKFDSLQKKFEADRFMRHKTSKEVESTKSRIRGADQNALDLTKQLNDLEFQAEQLRSVQASVTECEQSNRALEKQLHTLTNGAFQSDETEIRKIQMLMKEYNDQQKALLRRVDSLAACHGQLKQQLRDHDATLQPLKVKLSSRKEDLNVSQQRLQEATEAEKRLETDLDALGRGLISMDEFVHIKKRQDKGEVIDMPTHLCQKEEARKIIQDFETKNMRILECLESTKKELQREMQRQRLGKEEKEKLRCALLSARLERDRAREELRQGKRNHDERSVISDLSMFSTAGILSEKHKNLVVIEITRVDINENAFPRNQKLGPMTCVVVEFYEFDAVVSPLFAGWSPDFRFKSTYELPTDDLFLQEWLREDTEHCQVEIRRNHKFGLETMGSALLNLGDLVYASREAKGSTEIKRSGICLATIHFRAKIRQTLSCDLHQGSEKGSEVMHDGASTTSRVVDAEAETPSALAVQQNLIVNTKGVNLAHIPAAPASGPFQVYVQNPSDGEYSPSRSDF